MKPSIIFIFLLAILSCQRKIAKTSDFLIYDTVLNKLKNGNLNSNVNWNSNNSGSNGNLSESIINFQQENIYAVGLKWVDANFEGRTYQLPRSCDSLDLYSFFDNKALKEDESYSFEQMSKESYEQIKSRKKAPIESKDTINKREAPKVIQYSFLNFIDDCRVVFISDNHVDYNKKYNPVIKLKNFSINLTNKKSKTFERGYYYKSNDTLLVELRNCIREPSKKLYFIIKNNDLIFTKLVTYELKKNKTNNVREQRKVLEIDLENGLPDVVHLPVCFKIQKKLELKYKDLPIQSIHYQEDDRPENNFNSKSLIRVYSLKDSTIHESLNDKALDTW